jgi:glycosyltransferase involved in cell wall biosynthesis
MKNRRDQKKVLLVITKSVWGGAGRHVFDLATSLQKNGWNITVILGGRGPLALKLEQEKVPLIHLPKLNRDVRILNDIQTFSLLVRIFWKEKPAIVHTHSSKAGSLGNLAARLTRVPKIIFTAHGWSSTEEWRPRYTRFVIRLVHLLTIATSHATIAVSKKTKDEIHAPEHLSKKIIIIPNAITPPLFLEKSVAREKLLPHIEFTSTTSWIGSIAELHKNKGLTYLVTAIEKIRSLSAVLVIIGNGEEKERLEKQIKDLRLENRVFLVGFVENAASYLKAFDIFVLPSTKEGLPYVLIEAGFAGLPVLASDVGGISEIIEGGKNGFLSPAKDPDALATLLRAFIEKRLPPAFLPKKLALQLEKNVREKYTLDSMIKKISTLYTS